MNKYGRTALHVSFDSYYMAKKLLEKGANPNKLSLNKMSTVSIAIAHFNSQTLDIINLLIEYNFDIKKYINTFEMKRYDTILSLTCRFGNLECLQLILQHAKDNNFSAEIDYFVATNKGQTLIHLAAENNKYEIIEYLLKNIYR